MTQERPNRVVQVLKLLPGFAISGFFLWRVLRGLRLDHLRSMRIAAPVWISVLLLFLVADYALRGYRWWSMLRVFRARYSSCVRVLLTSLAANNILPFRVGDFMRIFAYASDVNAPSPAVLSTVILERLLDIFTLFGFLVIGLTGTAVQLPPLSVHGHAFGILPLAKVIFLLAAAGLFLLLFGTSLLHRVVNAIVCRFGTHPRTQKLGEWASLLFDAVLHLSMPQRLWLLVISAGVWTCESVVFLSAARMIGLVTGQRAPFLAASLANLSFLLPSAPGGIGPFDASASLAMRTAGVADADAGVYALFIHVILLFTITGVGGVWFLVHRAQRRPPIKPLSEDLAELPHV